MYNNVHIYNYRVQSIYVNTDTVFQPFRCIAHHCKSQTISIKLAVSLSKLIAKLSKYTVKLNFSNRKKKGSCKLVTLASQPN